MNVPFAGLVEEQRDNSPPIGEELEE